MIVIVVVLVIVMLLLFGSWISCYDLAGREAFAKVDLSRHSWSIGVSEGGWILNRFI